MIKSSCFVGLIVSVFLIGCTGNTPKSANDTVNDSVEKYLKLAKKGTFSIQQRDKFNQKALSFIDLKRNDTVVRWQLCEVALNFSRYRKKENYFKVSILHFKKSIKAHDTLNIARYYRFKAGFYKWNKLYDSAFYYCSKAEKFYKKIHDSEGLSRIYLSKSEVQFEYDDYQGAELSVNKSLINLNEKKDIKFTNRVLTTMGNIAHNLREYKKAIDYHRKALKLAIDYDLSIEDKSLNYKAAGYNNIGNAYKELKDFKKAIVIFNKGLEQRRLKQEDPLTYAYLLNNLGFCRMKMKNYEGLNNSFVVAAKIYDSLNVKNECAISYVYLSDYYLQTKDTAKAITCSEQALKLAKESKAPYYYLVALSNAGHVNKDKAPQYIQDYHRINDSLQFEQRKARSQFFKIQLETDEIAKEKEKEIKQKWVILSTITGVLCIVILLFIIYRQRMRQRQFKLVQEQQQADEEIYRLMLTQQDNMEEARQAEKRRIAQELHDGIMNRLISTRLKLFVLSKKNDEETIAHCLKYIEEIREIENEIRQLSHDLNQESFIERDNFGRLLNELTWFQNKTSQTKYRLEMDNRVNWNLLSGEKKVHLYRIVQEAVNNINKHAGATEAIISFSLKKDHLELTLSDNGLGFDPEAGTDGIGLKNIQQRIRSLKGVVAITSIVNEGTTIKINLPIR